MNQMYQYFGLSTFFNSEILDQNQYDDQLKIKCKWLTYAY